MLALLLARRNELVSADVVVDALWKGEVPANAVQTVRTYVSRLRKRLADAGSSPISTERGGYRLAVEDGQLDVDRFETLSGAARTALADGDAAEAERLLGSALELVRGRPFEGLEELEPVRFERERLEELRLLVDEDILEARLAQGRHRELVPELRARVGETPNRERLWALLMLALYRSGRQTDALAAFREARAALQDDAGLEAGRELRRLERMILLQERTLDHEAVGRLHGVPRYATSLVGREQALGDLCRRVRRGRLVSLVGPAGVGKTRLAAEATARLRRLFRDGVWWVDLGSATAGEVVASVGAALASGGAGGVSEPVRRLRGLQLLIVLDNCEHVLDESAELSKLVLEETAGVHLLVTSRDVLRVAGEDVVRVQPLSLPGLPASSPRILESSAVRLLAGRAGLDLDELDARNSRELAEIAIVLDGLPLAIELAARRLGSLSAPELARSLEQRVELLSAGDRTAPPRQRTLEAAIRWSYELLDEREQLLLLRLAAFRGSFTAEAAEAVAGRAGLDRAAVLPLLLQLVDHSLVAAEPGEPSGYRLLATTRTLVGKLAAERGELDGACRRHRDHYLARGEQIAAGMLGAQLPESLSAAHAEHENLLAALRWSLAEGHGDAALQLASGLTYYWYRISYLEGTPLLEEALALAPASSPWQVRGRVALAWLAVVARSAGAVALARAAAASPPDGTESRGLALLVLASALLERPTVGAAELAEAEHALREAHLLIDRRTQPDGATTCEQLLGVACFRRGDLDDALRRLRRARQAHRSLRGTLDAGWALVQLAEVELALGDAEAARSTATDAVSDFQTRRDPRGLAASFTALGRAYRLLGDAERSDDLLGEAAQLAALHGYRSEAEAAAALRSCDVV